MRGPREREREREVGQEREREELGAALAAPPHARRAHRSVGPRGPGRLSAGQRPGRRWSGRRRRQQGGGERELKGERENRGAAAPPSQAQGAGSPLAGRGSRPPAERRRGAGAGVAGGHPRGEIGRGQQPPPSNKPRPGHVALAGPNSGRISAARGPRRIAGGSPALGRRRRPGVAVGHPNSEEESG